MADTYSTRLRLTLMESGTHDSTWGTTANTQFELIEAAIAGRAAVTHDDTANYTLTTANGTTDEARCMILNIAGALGAARNVVVPTQSKFYVVKNATTGGFAVTVKTSAGTGISVPNGKTMLLMCDGTNVVNAIDVLGFFNIAGPTVARVYTFPDAAATMTYEGGTLGETTPNIVRGTNKEIFKTANGTLTAAECSGTVVSNYGMTDADCTIDLPTAAEGLSFVCILPTVRAKFFKLHCPTAQADKIYLLGVAGSDDGNVGVASGYATGSAISMFTFKASDGNYDWMAIPLFGTWVAS